MDPDALRRRWNAAAEGEEAWTQAPSLNRTLRWREVDRRLAGVRRVLDVGGGTGAFSIPLAWRGLEVVHLDLAPAMLEIARRKGAGLPNLRFVEGNGADLSAFADRAFDLVLAMDGPLSSAGEAAERVVAECCRVAAKGVIFTAAHRAFTEPAIRRGELAAGELRGFTAAELRGLIERQGLRVLRAGGLGSLATLCGKEHVASVELEAFADACEAFDRDVLPDGPGTMDDTGLIGVGERSRF